jgi:hypothetical protein
MGLVILTLMIAVSCEHIQVNEFIKAFWAVRIFTLHRFVTREKALIGVVLLNDAYVNKSILKLSPAINLILLFSPI